MSNINYELLDTVHKFIHRNPDAHRQETYVTGEVNIDSPDQYDINVCGTAACIAGWASVFDGWKQVPGSFKDIVIKNGVTENMHAAGRQSLGLDHNQAEALFDGGNELNDIDAMIDILHENSNATWDQLYNATGERDE